MKEKPVVAAIIPARGGSKRLKDKNIVLFHGKPLLGYAIKACKKSEMISHVVVSSDSEKILKIAAAFGATPILRDKEMAGDAVPKITAIRATVKQPKFLALGPVDILAVVQANSPEVTGEMLDRGLKMLLEKNLWEVMSCNDDGTQNAAFRLIRMEHLFNDFLSAHCGFLIANCEDIHTAEDIERLEKKIK